MNNRGITLPRKIDLVQIEKGIEIYNTLLELKDAISILQSKNQNIVSSEHIYLEKVQGTDRQKLKIQNSWQKNLKNDIFNELIKGKIDGVDTIEDILIKLNKLDENYNNVGSTIDNIREIIRKICEEEAYDIVQSELAALENTILVSIEKIKVDILSELYTSFNENIENVKNTIGELSGLHPYINEALGNNLTVKDALNFLFQLIVDLNENINLTNNKHGDNRAALVNSYNVEMPYPFVMPSDLGNSVVKSGSKAYILKTEGKSMHMEQQIVDNMNLKTIADQIKYRKNLNKIIDEELGDE